MKYYILKLKNSNLQDYNEIHIADIHNIIPVCDKEGNAKLLINFYDDEFCMDASVFCDEIETVETVEVE